MERDQSQNMSKKNKVQRLYGKGKKFTSLQEVNYLLKRTNHSVMQLYYHGKVVTEISQQMKKTILKIIPFYQMKLH